MCKCYKCDVSQFDLLPYLKPSHFDLFLAVIETILIFFLSCDALPYLQMTSLHSTIGKNYHLDRLPKTRFPFSWIYQICFPIYPWTMLWWQNISVLDVFHVCVSSHVHNTTAINPLPPNLPTSRQVSRIKISEEQHEQKVDQKIVATLGAWGKPRS